MTGVSDTGDANKEPTWDAKYADWICPCGAPIDFIDRMDVEGDTIVFYECGHGHPWARNNMANTWKAGIEPLRGRLTTNG